MPQFNAKVVSVDNNGQPIWQRGDRSIWGIILDVGGKRGNAKTYSGKIAQVGFEGRLESYEKSNNRNGMDMFVKQVQDENFTASSPSTSQPVQSSGGGSRSYQPKDDAAIKAMWAIGQSIAQLGNASPDSIEANAAQLFHMVDRVKNSPEEVAADTDGDKEQLNGLFGDVEVVDDGNDPWDPNQTQLPL